ncbi:MAG: amidohydrolase [Flavobacteriaceae bacterium]
MKKHLFICFLICTAFNSFAQNISKELEEKVIQWRHEIHQNPELSNREFKTAEKVATHLRGLGIAVQTGVAHTGVVGILKGKRPGKVLALRADMDALPVTERNDLPYKSTVRALFNGQETGVMHACGHDMHVAILMGVAEQLAKNNDFAGTVKFIFQPAEEGAPQGEEGGADLMIAEGVLDHPKVDAIFGLHINSGLKAGKVNYRARGIMASSQRFIIDVKGKQAHGSAPWMSVDPIVISAKILDGIQSIISRNVDLTNEAAVISVGSIHSGIRFNIIPESAQMIGTIRTLDANMKEIIRERMKSLIPSIAKAYGGEAVVTIQDGAPITFNDPALTAQMIPSIEKVLGKENVQEVNAVTGAEDFSYFQQEIPGLYFFLGGASPLADETKPLSSHHTPGFIVDDAALIHGVKVMTRLTKDYLNQPN